MSRKRKNPGSQPPELSITSIGKQPTEATERPQSSFDPRYVQHVKTVMPEIQFLFYELRLDKRASKKKYWPKRQQLSDKDAAIFNEWCAHDASRTFEGIGTKALAVPAYYTGSCHLMVPYNPEEDDTHAIDSKPKPRSADSTGSCNSALKRKDAEDIFWVSSKTDNDLKGENAQRLVGRALRMLNDMLEKEGSDTMFIMSQVHQDNILAWLRRLPKCDRVLSQTEKERLQAVIHNQPSMVKLPDNSDKRSENDLMIVHMKKGVVFIEVKGVCKSEEPGRTWKKDINTCIDKALKQLKKNEDIFRCVMENSKYKGISVQKVVAVPNVTRTDILAVGVKLDKGVMVLCQDDLFMDDIKIPASETSMEKVRQWFQTIPDLHNPLDLLCMQEIVGKYVGLLSTVTDFKAGNVHHQLRHFWDNVRYTSDMLRFKILSKSQRKALNDLRGFPLSPGRRIFFKGPPGSGKTLLLVLEARTFLAMAKDHKVFVLNMYRGSNGRSIGCYIFDNISSSGSFKGQICHLQLDVSKQAYGHEFITEVNKFLDLGAKKEELCKSKIMFVVDEIYAEEFWMHILDTFKGSFKNCHVLTASLFATTPSGFTELCLETIHRCPPSVQGLLYHVDWKEERKQQYVCTVEEPETVTNGPVPLCVRHEHHEQVDVTQCTQCASELANLLTKERRVQIVEPQTKKPEEEPQGATAVPLAGSAKDSGCDTTKYLKVLILVNIPRKMYTERSQYIQTTRSNYENYMNHIATCPFIQTLEKEAEGISMVVKEELACKDLAAEVRSSQCLATWIYNFQGLEADAVIFLPGDSPREPPQSGTCDSGSGSESQATHPAQDREIPTPGVADTKEPLVHAATGTDHSTDRSMHMKAMLPKADNSDSGLPYWNRHDIERFSLWDKTNILVAGSRCLSQLILIVP